MHAAAEVLGKRVDSSQSYQALYKPLPSPNPQPLAFHSIPIPFPPFLFAPVRLLTCFENDNFSSNHRQQGRERETRQGKAGQGRQPKPKPNQTKRQAKTTQNAKGKSDRRLGSAVGTVGGERGRRKRRGRGGRGRRC